MEVVSDLMLARSLYVIHLKRFQTLLSTNISKTFTPFSTRTSKYSNLRRNLSCKQALLYFEEINN